MTKQVFLNDKFVPLNKARVSILDRGFQYGDGVFETMRSYDSKAFMLEKHIDRLFVSLKILRIKMPYSKDKLCSLVNKTLHINRLKNAYIKLIVTRGASSSGIDIPRLAKPTIVIYVRTLEKIPEHIYKRGIKVNLACIDKNERSFISRIKSLNYLDNILAKAEAKSSGFDDAVLVNSKGRVSEATTSNLFIFKKGVFITPPPTSGLLPGITKDVVIGIIRRHFNNKIYEKDIKFYDLLKAEEVFLTNSILEIVPVVKIGAKSISGGKPGKMTCTIQVLYKMEARL